MSWWWVPIADEDAATERQFSIQDFLHQVIDILNACVPLYNWYLDDPTEAENLSAIPDYVVGTTNAQGIWAEIQERIEKLVDVFYDYDTIDNDTWFSVGSPDGPRAAPGFMHYNVWKNFKNLARAVGGIPIDHLMRQEDTAAAGIVTTIDFSPFQFPDNLPGFKWDSVSVSGIDLANAYYENQDPWGQLEEGYYKIEATGERSQDGFIYFSGENDGEAITVNYRVDNTRFGWTKRVNGISAGNISTEETGFDPITRVLSLTLTSPLVGAFEVGGGTVVNIWFSDTFNLDRSISSFISDTSFSVTLPAGLDPEDHGGTYAVRCIYETGNSLLTDKADDGDVIHACLLNQIYACTVVLQSFAVLVNASHSNVSGTPLTPGSSKVWTTWLDQYGTGYDFYYYVEVSEEAACEAAKSAIVLGYEPPYDPGPPIVDVAWGAFPDWQPSNPGVTPAIPSAYTGCAAAAGKFGSPAEAVNWTGSISKFSLTLEGVPRQAVHFSHDPANVKDFVAVQGPQDHANGRQHYISGVVPIVHEYIGGGKYYKSFDVRVTAPGDADYTLTEHGAGSNPIDAAALSCEDEATAEDLGAAYEAVGWACIQLNTPDPESLPP